MADDMTAYRVRCDCGNIEMTFETAKTPEALGVRACDCSFCAARNGRSISDPDGRVHIRVRDAAMLSRYRFGLKTADFLVCRECGAYTGAYFPDDDGRAYAIVSANYLEKPHGFTQEARHVDYHAETADQRRARRRIRWTPVASFTEGAGA